MAVSDGVFQQPAILRISLTTVVHVLDVKAVLKLTEPGAVTGDRPHRGGWCGTPRRHQEDGREGSPARLPIMSLRCAYHAARVRLERFAEAQRVAGFRARTEPVRVVTEGHEPT